MKPGSKVYLTGITGTVAPFLINALNYQGIQVVGDHVRVHEDADIKISLQNIEKYKPDTIFHLALGPTNWAEALARYAHQKRIKFIYISTASVFDDQGSGPYTIDRPVKATQGYALYKYQCESVVKTMNPSAYIIRIGWQVDPQQRINTNNMFRFFHEQLMQQGKIKVSDSFFPSASYLPDTVQGMIKIESMPSGLYHLNGNHHSLFAIAQYLKQKHQFNWVIELDPSFSRNDILLDARITLPPIVK